MGNIEHYYFDGIKKDINNMHYETIKLNELSELGIFTVTSTENNVLNEF